MKKLTLLLLSIIIVLSSNAQKVSIDKVEKDGQRTIISESYNLYTEWTSAAGFRLACYVSPTHDTTYILMLTLNEGKLQIAEGRKMLIKFDDNSIMELSNISEIGPADYTYHVTSSGTDYYVKPDYLVTETQIKELMTKKAVKVRIEHDIDVIDRNLSKKNKLTKGITSAYTAIKKALSTSKDIYTDF